MTAGSHAFGKDLFFRVRLTMRYCELKRAFCEGELIKRSVLLAEKGGPNDERCCRLHDFPVADHIAHPTLKPDLC